MSRSRLFAFVAAGPGRAELTITDGRLQLRSLLSSLVPSFVFCTVLQRNIVFAHYEIMKKKHVFVKLICLQFLVLKSDFYDNHFVFCFFPKLIKTIRINGYDQTYI